MPEPTRNEREPVIRIRALGSIDIPQVLGINVASRPAVAALDEQEVARLLALQNHHLVALNGENRIIGYALAFSRDAAYDGEEFLVFRAAISEPYVYIDQVAVLQEAKGTGVATALYHALEQMATGLGAYVLCCEINSDPPNPESMSFHTKMRFDIVGALATRDGRRVELRQKVLRK